MKKPQSDYCCFIICDFLIVFVQRSAVIKFCHTLKTMMVPMPTGFSTEILEEILRKSEDDKTISIVKTAVSSATQKGDNYTSDIYRVNFDYIRHCDGEEIKEKRSLIVKVALTSEGKQKDAIIEAALFKTEIDMMTLALNKMEMLLDDVKLSGKCYYTYDGNPSFLVIEDLSPLGYRLADSQNGLDLQHCLLTMRGLAKFHASSVAVCEKNPEYKTKYNKGMCHLNAPPEMVNFATSVIKNLAETVRTWPGINEICADKLMKLSDVIYEKLSILRQFVDSEFNVINHGDCWLNNILFRYNAQNQPVAQVFVDFQGSFYASPAIDLHHFLYSTPSEEVLINYTDKLINEYHQTLCETMKKLNCRTKLPAFDDLKRCMKKFELYGLLISSYSLAFALKKKDKAKQLVEFIDENGRMDGKELYDTPEYRTAISRRLLYWNKIGLLDNY